MASKNLEISLTKLIFNKFFFALNESGSIYNKYFDDLYKILLCI